MAQVQDFFTSEILVLPKKNSLDTEEDITRVIDTISTYLTQQKKIEQRNIIFFNQSYANFSIDEVRKMQVEAEYSSSFNGQENRAFVLLNFESASKEAQNATLKIIEESPTKTLVLLPVINHSRILETIHSRCLIIRLDKEINQANESQQLQQEFSYPSDYKQAIDLAQAYKDRPKAIDLIETLLQANELPTKKRNILLQTYQDLNNNLNVQLALENCFFSLVSLDS